MAPLSNTLKALQHNLGHGKKATTEIREVAARMDASVLLIQEPYVHKGNVCYFGTLTNRILTGCKGNETPGACIVLLSNSLDAVVLQHLSTSHCVCAEVTSAVGKTILVSLYCPPSQPIQPYLTQLRKIRTTLGPRKILIGADLNGRSPLWGSHETNERGAEVEDFLTEVGWHVINDTGHPPTFLSSNGESHIDATIASPAMLGDIDSWNLRIDWTGSDHRVIEVNLGSALRAKPCREPRFNIKRAKWRKFREEINENIGVIESVAQSTQQLEEKATSLTKLLHDACKNKVIPRKKPFKHSVPWWTTELTALKRASNRARRKYQREQDPEKRITLQEQYHGKRKDYSRKVASEKLSSWRSFIEREGNEEVYGIAYRVLMKKVSPDLVLFSMNNSSERTLSWEQTAAALLDSLIPDCAEVDRQDIRTICEDAHNPSSEQAQPWTTTEVRRVIKCLPTRKAPGHDLIETAMIKALKSSRAFLSAMTKLYNECLELTTFPREWKLGVIRVLLKSPEKDKANPKSYRPICLLPFFGKMLESLMKERLSPFLTDRRYASDCQYGFRAGRSTVDAICEVRRTVRETRCKYVLGLLYDATGAFDNLWWPPLIRELARRGCPRNLLALVCSYLQGREVEISGNYCKTRKQVTKGCPQGSILGPDFWNCLLDTLLRALQEAFPEIKIIAYADDLIVLIEANSRAALERLGQAVTDMISRWCDINKITLSQTKTEMILLKGSLVGRDPIIRIKGVSIQMKEQVKYLGVTFGSRLSVLPHINNISAKCKTLVSTLQAVAKVTWGLRYHALNVLYKGVYLAIYCYAAGAWADLIKAPDKKKMESSQRSALLLLTKAYRTTSTAALQVVCGATPIDLLVQQRRCEYMISKNRMTSFGDFSFENGDKRQAKLDLSTETLRQWQIRWDNCTKGRLTHEYFPSIEGRLRNTHFRPGHFIAQAITGHGNVKEYLWRFNLNDSAECRCGGIDSMDHRLFICDLNENTPRFKQMVLALGHGWPPSKSILLTEQLFDAFAEHAKKSLYIYD